MDSFAFFDAIHHFFPSSQPPLGERFPARCRRLGIAGRVTSAAGLSTPGDERIGVLLSHRRAVQAASDGGARSVLVLCGDVRFIDRSHDILSRAVDELSRRPWTLLYLGGWWPVVPEPEPGCRHLDRARDVGQAHAVAYSRDAYERVLSDWPADVAAAGPWVARHGDIDRCLAGLGPAYVVRPVVTTIPALLPFEPAETQTHFSL